MRGYAAFLAGRAGREPDGSRARTILRNEFALLPAGTPAVLILLASSLARWPTTIAIRVVLVTDVAILLGLGIVGASKAGYPLRLAVAIGFADALLGVLIIVASLFLR